MEQCETWRTYIVVVVICHHLWKEIRNLSCIIMGVHSVFMRLNSELEVQMHACNKTASKLLH
uniref:Uncharacterized protein n=1 Tax=Arundo donax TaxID=35708 RepID=A0A0A9E6J7_ARUDO